MDGLEGKDDVGRRGAGGEHRDGGMLGGTEGAGAEEEGEESGVASDGVAVARAEGEVVEEEGGGVGRDGGGKEEVGELVGVREGTREWKVGFLNQAGRERMAASWVTVSVMAESSEVEATAEEEKLRSRACVMTHLLKYISVI